MTSMVGKMAMVSFCPCECPYIYCECTQTFSWFDFLSTELNHLLKRHHPVHPQTLNPVQAPPMSMGCMDEQARNSGSPSPFAYLNFRNKKSQQSLNY